MRLALLLIVLGSAAFAQGGPPTTTIGQDSPPTGTCVDVVQTGNIYIRSANAAVLPIGVFRCTQIADPAIYGAGAFSWQPIGHFLGATLPAKCQVGQIAFKSGAVPGQNIYGCTSPNIWTLQSGGGGGGGPQTWGSLLNGFTWGQLIGQ